MDTREMTVADLEEKIDQLAVEHLWVDGNPVFAEVARKLDGTEDAEFGPLLLKALGKILELRIEDPVGCDILCLKTRYPDMTQHELAMAMTGIGHGSFSNRARACEALKALRQRFPELAEHMKFDRRGGDRHRRLSGPELLEEYERMVHEEREKPPAERRPVKADGSICHELARLYGIKGRDGKPSAAAVWMRVAREQKKSCGAAGNIVPTHGEGTGRALTNAGELALTASQIAELEALGLSAERAATLPEVAEAFGVSERTVRRLVAEGKLLAFRVRPRCLRVMPQDALAFLDAGTVKRTG